MRPIRITGITGTSATVPLDVYCISPALVNISTGSAGTIQITNSDVFNTAITLQWQTPAPAFVVGTPYVLPAGTRGVRAAGLAPGDIFEVSQQSIT